MAQKSVWARIEKINRKLIPLALLLLLGIIIFELFIHSENETVIFWVKVADVAVITIFVIDLLFLAKRARSGKIFLREYWLDILAVFPFSLAFSAVENIYRSFAVTERLVVGQAIVHESLETEKLLAKSGRFAKYGRILARGVRLSTKVWSGVRKGRNGRKKASPKTPKKSRFSATIKHK